MADDLDFRPEALEPGDQIRWLGRWYTVTEKRFALGLTRETVVLDVEADGDELTLAYRPGCWVAAQPKARVEA